MMPMLVDRGHPDTEMGQRADELLERVGLSRWRNKAATNMSGGQQQRVAIARALAMNPDLVLADEPTGNLDTKSAASVFELMRQVNRERGTTFLLVTHNDDLARRCDRIVQVVDGSMFRTRSCVRPDRSIGGTQPPGGRHFGSGTAQARRSSTSWALGPHMRACLGPPTSR